MNFNGKVLVVVDMQVDFISGSLGSESALQIVMPVREKIQKAHEDGTAVLFTMDTHDIYGYSKTLEGKKLPIEHCIYGTEGWELHPVINGVIQRDTDIQIIKEAFGACGISDFIVGILDNAEEYEDYHDDLAEIEVCGLCTDICVMANIALLRTAFPNTIIKVDSKACAGSSKEAHEAALKVMKSLQIDVI